MSLSPGDKQTETGIFSDFFEFWSKTDFFSALSLRYLNLYMETLVVTFCNSYFCLIFPSYVFFYFSLK